MEGEVGSRGTEASSGSKPAAAMGDALGQTIMSTGPDPSNAARYAEGNPHPTAARVVFLSQHRAIDVQPCSESASWRGYGTLTQQPDRTGICQHTS